MRSGWQSVSAGVRTLTLELSEFESKLPPAGQRCIPVSYLKFLKHATLSCPEPLLLPGIKSARLSFSNVPLALLVVPLLQHLIAGLFM